MMFGKKRIFCIASIKASTHTSHQGDDLLPLLPTGIRSILYNADTLNAWDDWLFDIVAKNFAFPQNFLRMIQPKCLDFNKAPSRPHLRYRHL